MKIRTNNKAGQSEVGGSGPVQFPLMPPGEAGILESRPSGTGRMDTIPLGGPRGQRLSRFL